MKRVWKNQQRCAFCAGLIYRSPDARKTHLLTSFQTPQLSTSAAASASSASWLPGGPHCGVRVVKNRPLPQTVPSKSIHIPYSDQFVKAPLLSGGWSVCVCVCVNVHVCVLSCPRSPSLDPSVQSGHSKAANCPTFDPTQTATSRHKSCQLSPVWAYISLEEV